MEVLAHDYQFLTPRKPKSFSDSETDSYLSSNASIQTPQPVEPSPPFRYNPVHDVESLWWVAVYFIVNKEVVGFDWSSREAVENLRNQRRLGLSLFERCMGRQGFVQYRGRCADWMRKLHPDVRQCGKILESCRQLLVGTYTAAEKDPENVGFEVAGRIHKGMRDRFHHVAAVASATHNVHVRPFTETNADFIL